MPQSVFQRLIISRIASCTSPQAHARPVVVEELNSRFFPALAYDDSVEVRAPISPSNSPCAERADGNAGLLRQVRLLPSHHCALLSIVAL